MNTHAQHQNEISRFVEWLREGIPTLIAQGTGGKVVQTAYRELLPQTANGHADFAVYLSDGAAFRIRVQQLGEGRIDEAGCQECGELFLPHELNEHRVCSGCAQERWDAMSAEEQAEWCRLHKVHYPYVDKGPASPEQLAWIRQLLESHPWRLARSQPHWYTLRHEWQDVGDEVFNEVNRMIREHGRSEYFGTYPWRMLDVNGFKYWNYYSTRVENVIVLNRKPLVMTGQETRS